MGRVGRPAQLRKADRQGRSDHVKRGTLAETLAEQSELSRIPHRFRLSDPTTGRLLEAQPRLVHCCPAINLGSRVERDDGCHPLWRCLGALRCGKWVIEACGQKRL